MSSGIIESVRKRSSSDRNSAKTSDSVVDKPPDEQASLNRPTKSKNPHAVALGRLGGQKGGKARAEKLSPARLKAIAKNAAEARWRR